jgi:hypothetical protein
MLIDCEQAPAIPMALELSRKLEPTAVFQYAYRGLQDRLLTGATDSPWSEASLESAEGRDT